jgi:hypothetical protein
MHGDSHGLQFFPASHALQQLSPKSIQSRDDDRDVFTARLQRTDCREQFLVARPVVPGPLQDVLELGANDPAVMRGVLPAFGELRIEGETLDLLVFRDPDVRQGRDRRAHGAHRSVAVSHRALSALVVGRPSMALIASTKQGTEVRLEAGEDRTPTRVEVLSQMPVHRRAVEKGLGSKIEERRAFVMLRLEITDPSLDPLSRPASHSAARATRGTCVSPRFHPRTSQVSTRCLGCRLGARD